LVGHQISQEKMLIENPGGTDELCISSWS
jgi:hypothetical protein